MNRSLLIISIIFITISCRQGSERDIPFYDQSLSNEQRIADLISRMTLEEKISQLNYDAAAIGRLGIPEYNWWNECLHGVGRAGLATVFPQAIGMGATWNKELMNRIGTVISDEARAKHEEFLRNNKRSIYYGLTFWTPNINIFRDPRWGRGQETYGEDPRLTGLLAVPFIEGLQGTDPKYLKLVATSKHFAVHSGPESERHSMNVEVDEGGLRETYLPAFEMTVKEGGVASVMCAYNRVREEACCGSNLLLKRILRDEWNFQGYVVSDCWALADFYSKDGHHLSSGPAAAAALSYSMGTDLNCGVTSPYLKEAVEKGLIGEEVVDQAVRRLFLARLRLGMFDSPDSVTWSKLPYSTVRSEVNLSVALQASRESLVLLKNNGLLPLQKDLKNIAVIGPLADDYKILLGNYHGTSDQLITPLQGIKNILATGGTRVSFAPGCAVAEELPLLKTIPSGYLVPLTGEGNGLSASYYGNREFSGEPAFTHIDSLVDFFWYDESPVTKKLADDFSVRWEGFLAPEKSGTYSLGLNACNASKLYLEDSLYLKFDNGHEPGERYFHIDLEAGKQYKIKVEFINYGNDPQVHLLWQAPGRDLEKEALDIAGKADAVILVMGITPQIEGEQMPVQLKGFAGGDRTDLVLPESQESLMKKFVALNKPTVLVLIGGSAIAVNWADQHVPAILDAWYPGEFGGQAIAEAIFGDINPSGKLPVTFYRSVNDLPPFGEYSMENRTYKYFRGPVLYPFGHGLSYTSFGYTGLSFGVGAGVGVSVKIPSSDKDSVGELMVEIEEPADIPVSVKVRNTGTREGMETVQLYVSVEGAAYPAPRIALQDFVKINLAPGESKEVSFTLHPDQLAAMTESGEKILKPGNIKIYVGGKQPGMKGNSDARTTEVVSGIIKYTGQEIVVRK
ncbi:MAG TPA: glycoside hydrolase family 3 C-terminal domain-containing protein [Cyclobacteriaceae bacterium]|nr:glycoside hydrolase family 3 C-terminal domain-containing protein [Cyclobacteriaceae bacterium]